MSKKLKCTLLVLLVAGVSIFTVSASTKEKTKEETEEVVSPEPLVIETEERNKNGTLTIYAPDGGVYYQYMGEIDVKSNGVGGKEVEVIINLPSLPCSCFDDNGNIKE